jgi:hypothetical protein
MIKTTDTTNKQLVAAWNVLMFATKTISDKADLPAKIAEVGVELVKRSIPHVFGKKIVAV